MAEFYEYCLPPGVHTMRLECFDRPFVIKMKHKFFRFVMVVLILRHFWPPLSFPVYSSFAVFVYFITRSF